MIRLVRPARRAPPDPTRQTRPSASPPRPTVMASAVAMARREMRLLSSCCGLRWMQHRHHHARPLLTIFAPTPGVRGTAAGCKSRGRHNETGEGWRRSAPRVRRWGRASVTCPSRPRLAARLGLRVAAHGTPCATRHPLSTLQQRCGNTMTDQPAPAPPCAVHSALCGITTVSPKGAGEANRNASALA